MYIAYTEEQEALRKELRAYYDKLLTPEIREALHIGHGTGETMRAVVRQMAADGWLGIGWPVEYGGQGRSQIEQFIFFDESMRSGAPVPMLTINTVGPTLMQYGTEEQKSFYLPKILTGEIHFCIGYTEPNAGTDLAALTTRAERDGDEYVINGQKVFTSLASDADYVWLATRTDPDAPKHAGLSMFVVDMKTPGLRSSPWTCSRTTTSARIFLDDVRVPAGNLVGRREQGLGPHHQPAQPRARHHLLVGNPRPMSHRTRASGPSSKRLPDGRRVIDQEWVQLNLARVYAGLEFLKLINWKVAWTATQDRLDVADASTIKVFGTEWYLESFQLLMEVLGQRGYLRRGSPEAAIAGQLETLYRGLLILTFGGGTNEIQRDLIGMFGLKLPRAPRF